MEVNVSSDDVVVQKLIREGFGLVVAEALWKEKPVVAGRAGVKYRCSFRYSIATLFADVEGCAAAAIHLLRHYGERGRFGRAGREHVRRNFLARLARG